MANNKTIYARFFSKKGIEIEKKFWINKIKNLQNEVEYWKIFYNIDLKRNFVDFIYIGKPRNELPEFFYDETINKKFDIWIRLTDEGSFHDIIGCKSISSTFSKIERSKSLMNWGYCLRDWDYAKICIYQANQLRLTFRNSKLEYPNEFISKWLGDIIVKEIRKNKWTLNTDILYAKSSYNNFDSSNQAEEIDFYKSRFRKTNGEINHVMNDYSLLNLNRLFFSKIHNWKLTKLERRLTENLESIEFIYKEKIMEKIWWNEDENCWEEDVCCYWDNCNDYEYLKFMEKRKEN